MNQRVAAWRKPGSLVRKPASKVSHILAAGALCAGLSGTNASGQDTMVRNLEGEIIGTQERFDLAVGGEFTSPWNPPGEATALGDGIYAVTLNNTGTGWAERFLIGLPLTGAGAATFAPALVLFHAYGETPDDLLVKTDYFAKAQARGMYVIAPLAAHQYHFSIEYAQRNVEVALGWSAQYLNLDLDRLYALGFSMGAGMATSYSARHQDPARARFAAILNHTGSASIRDVYNRAGVKSLLTNPLMFAGAPFAEPFAYRRASTIDISGTGAIHGGSDFLRNLAHVPVRTYAALYDPIAYLVNQSEAFDAWLASRGGASDLILGGASLHEWGTLDEDEALDWFDGKTLAEPGPNTTHRLLADRAGAWQAFEILPFLSTRFVPLTWHASQAGNRLFLVGAQNLRQLSFDPAGMGLDTTQDLTLIFGSTDGRPTNLIVKGLSAPPTQVLRNGVPATSWIWHAATNRLILRELKGNFTPTWKLLP